MLRKIYQLVSLRDFCPYAQQLTFPLAGRLVACVHTLPAEQGGAEPSGQLPDAEAAVEGTSPDPSNVGWVPEDQQLLLQAAIVGVPNAGKSTLINTLVGQKVSAVSPKTNTTVYSRLGGFTEGRAQVVLYDTPGVVGSQHYKNPRHERRVKSAWTVAADCDLVLFILDAHRQLVKPDPRVERLLTDFGSGSNLGLGKDAEWDPPPAVLLMNKVDAVPKEERPSLLPLADKLRRMATFEEVFWVSALHGRGVADLKQYLTGRATPGQWTLEPDAATDRSQEELALEVVRENIFRRFYEELPYQLEVVPISFKPLQDGSLRIEHHVLVDSERVKKIVVGKQGAAIGVIGRTARLELEKEWKRRVHLILDVKVMKGAQSSKS